MASLFIDNAFLISGFVIQTIIFIVGLFIFYYKSYASEKGKNLATKEDIGEITKTVENIKTEFIKETEKLKIDLQFDSQIRVSFYNDKKNALLNLFECLNIWHNHISTFQTNSIDFNLKKLKKAEADLDQDYANFEVAESKLELYIENDTFFKLLDDLTKQISNYQALVEIYFSDLEEIIEEEIELNKFDIDKEVSIIKRLSELDIKKQKLWNAHQDKTIEKYREMYTKFLDFSEMCRDILKNKIES